MTVMLAVAGGILGLATLLLPRSLMLFGERWTLKDGDRAEPSDLYVLYVRGVGVVILLLTAGFTIAMVSLEHAQAREAELEELWDVSLYPGDEVAVVADPRIVTSTAIGDGQVALWPTRTAIVGRDELGGLDGVSAFDDGDILVGMGYSACTFSHLIVARDGGETRVSIVVTLPEIGPLPDLPGVPPDVEASPPPLDTFQGMQLCTRRFSNQGATTGLTVFRVRDGD